MKLTYTEGCMAYNLDIDNKKLKILPYKNKKIYLNL